MIPVEKDRAMTTDTIMILSGIVFAFALFAATLMWGDIYTHRRQ